MTALLDILRALMTGKWTTGKLAVFFVVVGGGGVWLGSYLASKGDESEAATIGACRERADRCDERLDACHQEAIELAKHQAASALLTIGNALVPMSEN